MSSEAITKNDLLGIFSGLGLQTDRYAVQRFDSTAATISSGTIGGNGLLQEYDISKTGYTPVLISLVKVNHPTQYNVVPSIYQSINKAYLNYYRTVSTQQTESAGGIQFEVLYVKS